MKPESPQHGLLNDVLAENAPANFERALLDGTLRAVRRRRRLRRSSSALAVAGVSAAIGLAVWSAFLPTGSVNQVQPSLRIVRSRPLSVSMIVARQPGSLVMVISSSGTFVAVETGSIKDPFQVIDDEQLLALAGSRPVALVRQGPHQAELLFLNPEDTDGFLVH